ncbi:MAG: hypothetical protein RSA84_20525 [Acinetobacter sp.]
MIITQVSPNTPLSPPGVLMMVAFDFSAYPLPRMRSIAPKITQNTGQQYFKVEYLLPDCTRVGDVLEFYLVDVNTAFPVRVLTYTLDDYSIFWSLRRQQGVFIRGEISVNVLIARGITPGTYDLEAVQYGGTTPTPPSPSPQVTVLPTRNTAVSFLNTYVIT